MAAAVADFRPVRVAGARSRRPGGRPEVVLERTADILAGLGTRKPPGQTLVGFAAETDDVRQNAANKLVEKGADLIVANDVTAAGAGFEHDTNRVVILKADGSDQRGAVTDKRAVARAVLDAVLERRTKQ